MRPLFFSLVLFLSSACRPPSTTPRRPPLDFDALPGPTAFSTEATLAARWPGTLKDSHDSGERGSLKGVGGVELQYLILRVPAPKAAVVFLAGRTEPIRKYAELFDDLNRNGYSVYAMDVRGQGASGRMLPNPQKGYVYSFQDYVDDLHSFVTTVVKKDTTKKVFLVAHSMSGATSVLAADQYPEDFAGVALSSPMLEIDPGSYPAPLAGTLGETFCGTTDGTGYIIGAGDFTEETDFSKSTVTNSLARWTWKVQLTKDVPELKVGGPTWRWTCESLAASSTAAGLGAFATVPVLLFQAGKDTIVKPGGQKRYCDASPVCQLVLNAEAKHEQYVETDAVRDFALSRTLKFFDAEVTR